MIKFKVYIFALIIFIGLGVAAYLGFNAWEDSHKNDPSFYSQQLLSIAGERAKDGETSRVEKVTLEELASKSEKVTLEEGLSRINQANKEMKEVAERFDINALIAHLQKGELVEVIKHFRGESSAKQIGPLPKGVQERQAEKDNTDALQAQIELLKTKQAKSEK